MFLQLAGIPTVYSSGTVDTWSKNVCCQLMYGHSWRIPVPDIDRTDFMVVQGANPSASQGSFMGCPDVPGALDLVRERGKVVVIDPPPQRDLRARPISGCRCGPAPMRCCSSPC